MDKIRLRVAEMMAIKSKELGRDITATDVAKAIKVSHNTILAYLRSDFSNPSTRVLYRLAKYFGCSIEDLLVIEEAGETPELMAV